MDRRIPIQIQSIAAGNAYLGAAWGVGNKLASFTAPRINSHNDKSEGVAKKCGEVHTVAFETSLYSPIFDMCLSLRVASVALEINSLKKIS